MLIVFSNVNAASESGINVTHCDECGKVLIGSARIDMHSIQWQGAHSKGILVFLNGARETDSIGLGSRTFGFTGSFEYDGTPNATLLNYTTSGGINQWTFVSTGEVAMDEPAPNGNAPSIGFYFSPSEAKQIKSSAIYSGICSVSSSCQNVYYPSENAKFSGEGVGDNVAIPALTLDVKVNDTSPIQSDISVGSGSTTTFTITPKLNKDNLPADVLQPEYVEIFIKIDEINTNCKSTSANPSFRDKQDISNDFSLTNYYHYLKVEETKQCSRTYSYLVSIDRPFNFEAANQAVTANGYVQYSFFIKGHYNPYSPVETEYPGSHHTFRLRTSNIPVSTNTLTVNVTGNGKVTSNSGNINCPTNCSSSYTKDASVVLTATPNTNTKFSGWSGNCTGTSTTTNITLDANKNCTATFIDETATPNTFTLDVTVKDKESNQAIGGTIKVNNVTCNLPCNKAFSANTSVTLTAIPNSGYNFDSWIGCQSSQSTTLPLTMTSNQNCTAQFVKKAVVSTETACFTIDYVADTDTKKLNKVNLDATCSGNVSSYNWQIYPLNGDPKVSYNKESLTTAALNDGDYIATLIVGEEEAQNQTSKLFTIPPLLAQFEIQQDANVLKLDASTTSASLDSGKLTYHWFSALGRTIQDGIQVVVDYSTGIIDALEKYETITLAVIDEKGRISTTSQKAKVNTAMDVEITSFDIHSYIPTGNNVMTVTLCAQAQDPDGGEITHVFTDSYGTPIQGTLTEESDEQCLEANRLKAQFTYTTSDNTQPVIADTYYLDVKDNEGTEKDAVVHISIPEIKGAAINNTGAPITTTTIFHGGISTDGGKFYQNNKTVKLTDQIAIRGYFETDENDVSKIADILLVMGLKVGDYQVFLDYQSKEPNTLASIDEISRLTGLANYTGIALKEEMAIAMPFTGIVSQVFNGFVGTVDIYLGYRLQNGTIVYGVNPITLTITQ